jgi:4-amino-4-deoxy-L-arabinose transferase-like glycosyltransferase
MKEMWGRIAPAKWCITGFFIFLMLLQNVNNDVSLWDQDEAAYAGFAQKMIRSGNRLIPEFMWSESHRKPPLHFWDIAMSFKAFGVSEFALRLPAALSVWLTFLLTFLMGKTLFGKRATFLGILIGSTTLFIPVLAKVSVTDGTLLLLTTICALSLIRIMEGSGWKDVLIFWMSFALALLLKGPPIILFTGAFGLLLLIFHPRRKRLIRLHPWLFFPLACLPLLGWGYAAWRRDPEFIRWMIDWYILKRVNGSVFGQEGPPGMHLLMIIAFFIPWIILLPKAFTTVVRNFRFKNRRLFYLGLWFVAAWLIYELSPSKLPAYVVPAHIPLALICGSIANDWLKAVQLPGKAWRIAQAVAGCLLGAVVAAVPMYLDLGKGYVVIFIVSGFIYGGMMIYTAMSKEIAQWFKRLFLSNIVLQILIWGVLLRVADPLKDATREIGRFMEIHLPAGSIVYIGNDEGHPPSLPFYISQHNEVGEEHDPEQLLSLYHSHKHVGMVLKKKQAEYLEERISGVKVHIFNKQLTDRKEKAAYYVIVK